MHRTPPLFGRRSSYFQLFYAPWLAELFVLHKDVSLINMSLVPPDPHAPRNPDAISEHEINRIKDSMCQGINARTGISSASAMLNYYRGWVDNETWRPIAAADRCGPSFHNLAWRADDAAGVQAGLLSPSLTRLLLAFATTQHGVPMSPHTKHEIYALPGGSENAVVDALQGVRGGAGGAHIAPGRR